MAFLLKLKVFWAQLKFFIRNAIESSYEGGQLSVSLRKSIITCIPKGDKDQKLMKNWHPISLLCTVYKLASSAIAAQLKLLLTEITSQPNRILSGRYMEESTRLIYGLMHYTETKQISGLLMLIDFEKAFDSVSW